MHVIFLRVNMSREWSKSENCYRKLSLPEMTVYINSQESVKPFFELSLKWTIKRAESGRSYN